MTVRPSLPAPVLDLIGIFNQAGFECFVVGGFLRDFFLGRPTRDLDLATSARPPQVADLLSPYYRTLPTGLAHGTLTVLADQERIEVTTFRREGVYSDFRHPDEVWFTDSLEEDLARRDFSINAMAWHPDRGLIDPWQGRPDIDRKLIRAVGVAHKRFGEDALRILRALRFSSELGFAIEPVTRQALRKQGPLLAHVARERIRLELEGLLTGPHVEKVLAGYARILYRIIPELASLSKTQYDAAVKRVGQVSPDPLKRMAALLLDLDEVLCAGTAQAVAQSLRFSKVQTERIGLLAGSRTLKLDSNRRSVWRALHALGQEVFFDVLDLWRADQAASGQGDGPDALEEIAETANQLLAEGRNLSLADLAIDGNDLRAQGEKGPAIGRRLERLLEAVCVDGLSNDRQTLLNWRDPQASENIGSGHPHP